MGTTILSAEECSEIDHLLEHYPAPGGASIDALKIVQKHRGWVSDEALVALAGHMGITPAELDSVATFYNLIFRKPVGDHVVHPCDGVSCLLMGYRKVHQQLKEVLKINDGETSEDNQFTLVPLPCLGACDKAPVVLVDETLYENVASDGVEDMINEAGKKESRRHG